MYVILFACFSLSLAGPITDPVWEEYKQEYGKVYSSVEEEESRYQTWKAAVQEIKLHNVQFAAGEGYQQGVNQFTDMSEEEFLATHANLKVPDQNLPATHEFVAPNDEPLPEHVDWRTKGYVAEVKDQGHCGSCYSFSATGSLEGQWYRKTGKLISLSEEQIIDCSYRYGNQGCNGGWYQNAWAYIKDAGGSETEKAYGYTAGRTQKTEKCHDDTRYMVSTVKGWYNLDSGNEDQLTQALAAYGPVAVAIDASRVGFRRYETGVFYDDRCSSYRLNHAVLAVGYGSENGQDYYLVKNSWGTRYGNKGYIKMARNKSNACGIATRGSFPAV